MLQPGVNLVLEFLTVDRASSSAGAGRIAGLDHEVGYDAVEDDAVVVASLRERRKIVTSLKTVNNQHRLWLWKGQKTSFYLGCMFIVELHRE